MPELESVIQTIRSRLSRGAYVNETMVRTQIVQPILQGLGWDVYDPDKVCDEYSLRLKTTTRRIDLALCVSNRNPRCIVELKSTKYALKQAGESAADQQLFEYAFYAGAPLAVLTNGINWRLYSTQSAGTYQERLVNAFDLSRDPPDNAVAQLQRYLSFENTKSGAAADFARSDLDRHKARESIPQGWAQLVEGGIDRHLVDLLTESTSRISEASPTQRDVADFLRSLRIDAAEQRRRAVPVRRVGKQSVSGSAESSPGREAAQARATKEPERPIDDGSPPAALSAAKTKVEDPKALTEAGASASAEPTSGRGRKGRPEVTYWLLGKELHARSAKEAYVAVFDRLSERDPTFLTRVEPKLRGRKNRGLVRTSQELHLMPNARAQLSNGWWLDTNLSNQDKIRRLRIACDVAEIAFGNRDGLDIDLPTIRRSRVDRRVGKQSVSGSAESSPGREAAQARATKEPERPIDDGSPPAVLSAAKTKVEDPKALTEEGASASAEPTSGRGRKGRPEVTYWLLGKELHARSAIEAYVTVFTRLSERDPTFLTRVEPKLRGRKNRGLVRTSQELHLMPNSRAQLSNGWWLDTHLSNKAKIRRLRIACDVAGIALGDRDGLDIDLPGT